MSTPARRRLYKDLKAIQKEKEQGIMACPSDEEFMTWTAVIFGPPQTPFEDGVFRLSMEFTEEYPEKAPIVKFVTNIFHPNVYPDGSICLDILQNRWSSTYHVLSVLTSIQSLLGDPNADSPANNDAAQLFVNDTEEYERRVRATVEESWINNPASLPND
eukprot:m.18523 g.18523  ORF g.18523 m.18523 type:complete len:160 (-) comp4974_c0_seq1:274-753(-)